MSEIDSLKAKALEGMNPRDIKYELAGEIVERFHSPLERPQGKRRIHKSISKARNALRDRTKGCEGFWRWNFDSNPH